MDEYEEITPDTDTPRTFEEMAAMLDRYTCPTTRQNEPIGCDPDDYQLF